MLQDHWGHHTPTRESENVVDALMREMYICKKIIVHILLHIIAYNFHRFWDTLTYLFKPQNEKSCISEFVWDGPGMVSASKWEKNWLCTSITPQSDLQLQDGDAAAGSFVPGSTLTLA